MLLPSQKLPYFRLFAWLFYIVFSFICVEKSDGARILFIQVFTSYSHQLAVWPYSEELLANQHKVTWLTPHLPRPRQHIIHENFTLVHAAKMENVINGVSNRSICPSCPESMLEARFTGRQSNAQIIWPDYLELSYSTCEALVRDPSVREWFDKETSVENLRDQGRETPFDLLIIDGSNNDCALGFAHLFKAPYIYFDTTVPLSWQFDHFGFSPESSWIPDFQHGFPQPISFFNRVHNTILPLWWYFSKKFNYFPKLQQLFFEEFHETFPDFEDLYRNASLVFSNCHWTEEYARAFPPLFVPVGGIHVKTDKRDFSKPIASPKDIPLATREFISKYPQGFIYISFGSFVSSHQIPDEIQYIFFETIGKFPDLGFVMRWDDAKINGSKVPDNVLLVKWMPQQAILSEPRLKTFISHSGMLGTIESIYFGVPTISLGVFWDQTFNGERTGRMGRGITLDWNGLTQNQLVNAITEIITNEKYKKKMDRDSKLFKDRQVHPLKLAIWWTDYILRHKTVPELKPLGMHQTWYQRRLLDVWAFIALSIIFSLLMCIFFVFKMVQFVASGLIMMADEVGKAHEGQMKKFN